MKNLTLHLDHYVASALWPLVCASVPLSLGHRTVGTYNSPTRLALSALFAVGVRLLVVVAFGVGHTQAALTYTSSGTFVPPVGVTSIQVECWGGGGAGGAARCATSSHSGGGGGGGGAYTKATGITVTPDGSYTVTVGAGGASSSGTSTDGGTSSINTSAAVIDRKSTRLNSSHLGI